MSARPIIAMTLAAAAMLFAGLARAAGASSNAGEIVQQFNLMVFAGRIIPWSGITYLGDSALTTPCAVMLAIWLALNGKIGAATRWSLVFCAGMGLVVLTKLAFMGWNITLPGLNFTGISGHSASIISVLPVLVFLLSAGLPLPVRIATIGAAFVLILLIGVSRVVLQAHSGSEVVIGLVLGACVSLYFITRSDLGGQALKGRPVILLAMLLLAGASGGRPAPTQDWLTHLAVALSGNPQPYTRSEPL